MLAFDTELIGSEEAIVTLRGADASERRLRLDDELVRLAKSGRRRIIVDPGASKTCRVRNWESSLALCGAAVRRAQR